VTSGWFFLSTLNYDARSTTHQIFWSSFWSVSIFLTDFKFILFNMSFVVTEYCVCWHTNLLSWFKWGIRPKEDCNHFNTRDWVLPLLAKLEFPSLSLQTLDVDCFPAPCDFFTEIVLFSLTIHIQYVWRNNMAPFTPVCWNVSLHELYSNIWARNPCLIVVKLISTRT
jgi:hypothetical protein